MTNIILKYNNTKRSQYKQGTNLHVTISPPSLHLKSHLNCKLQKQFYTEMFF
jgi:hypothetical protein